ncbi:MAG: butyrate kinase [Clostridium celatum]|nr:butyrate kinase [Clostridium celatum]
MSYKILAINPGSTSTKIAYYEDKEKIFSESIDHDHKELDRFEKITDQFELRKNLIIDVMKNHGVKKEELAAVVARGGLIVPLKAGGYIVTEDMKKRIINGPIIPHASNLGALIADAIAKPLGIPAYIYDAVSSDEMDDFTKITGIPEIKRESLCHVLNSKAMARKIAESIGRSYSECNFIVAHLGGGISISAHRKGKICDLIADDCGTFSPERAGTAPLVQMVDLCYSGKYSHKEMQKKVRGNGGLKALLDTSDAREVQRRINNGDKYAEKVYYAMAYQIAKGIAQLSVAFKGKIDGIILTGGVAYSEILTNWIKEYVRFLAPIYIQAGENELESLAFGAFRILNKQEEAISYKYEV